MLSFMRKTPEFYEGLASVNPDIYQFLFSQLQKLLSHFDSLETRKACLKMMAERLAEDLRWRFEHGYNEKWGMNRALGEQYRSHGRKLLRRSRSGNKDIFNREWLDLADGFAGVYLVAESLYFEKPSPIQSFSLDRHKQKDILRDLNSILTDCGFQDVVCTARPT
jgi:hypothetical protein